MLLDIEYKIAYIDWVIVEASEQIEEKLNGCNVHQRRKIIRKALKEADPNMPEAWREEAVRQVDDNLFNYGDGPTGHLDEYDVLQAERFESADEYAHSVIMALEDEALN